MTCVYLGLGSNLGERDINLFEGVHLLGQHPQIRVKRQSEWIETAPVGNVDQPMFLNGVLEIETNLNPIELLEVTTNIESQMGRTTKGDYEPRTLDIDILLYGGMIICLDELTIPHPLLHERQFVLAPLAELAPNLEHPMFGETIQRLLNNLEHQ